MATRGKTTAAGFGAYWQRQVRPRILARDRYRCHWCGGRATEVDHVVARAEGGALYDPANLVASCGTCNRRRGGEVSARSRRRRGLPPLPTLGARMVRYGAIDPRIL